MRAAKHDRDYLAARKKLSERQGPRELWSVIDHWPLYCGIGNLARFIAISDLVRRVRTVPGHIAEFGSWRGANLMFMAKLNRIFDPHGSKRVLCFDSFQGLTTFTDTDGSANKLHGKYQGSLGELRELIALYDLDDDIEIHAGLIGDTLAPLLAQREELSFSLVYVDVDLYAPTRDILQAIHPRLMPGGIIVFDEWNHRGFPGETVAAREFMAMHPDAYIAHHVMGSGQPSLFLERKT